MNSYKFLNKFSTLSIFHKRFLLTKCSNNVSLTSTEARKLLQNIVGSPKHFGDPVDGQVEKAAQQLPKSQKEMPEKRMMDSYRETFIPLSSNKKTRDKYLLSETSLRFGRFFEDLDTLAVLISYSHLHDDKNTNEKSPVSVVTASVDSLKTKTDQIDIREDIQIRGHVTWVGSSSMDVTMVMEQQVKGEVKEIIAANFLMVARDPITKKKAFVNPLKISTPEEETLLQLGEANKKERKLESDISILKIPPSQAERITIHDLFLQTVDSRNETIESIHPPPNSIWISEAGLKNVIHCFPEQRNLYHKVFGGYLMRKAMELAQANAFNHCHCGTQLAYVDNISFRHPVEIGHLLFLSSRIVYTYKKLMQLRVHAQVKDPMTGETKTTNTFQFTFKAEKEPSKVMPRNYSEYLLYIEGKRHLENHL